MSPAPSNVPDDPRRVLIIKPSALGDVVTAGPAEGGCACGCSSPWLDGVEGRISDLAVTPSGRKVSGSFTTYLMTEGVHRFRVHQLALDRFKVLVERTDSFGQKDIEKITANFAAFFGEDVAVEIEPVDRIPAEKSGKLRRFVSELDQG